MGRTIPELDPSFGGMDPAEWPLVADAAYRRRASAGYIQTQLHVRRHSDGRLLAYASIKDGDVVTPMGGTISRPRNEAELRKLLGEAIGNLRGFRQLVEACLRQIARLDRKGNHRLKAGA